MTIIDDFIQQYDKQYDYHQEVARLAAQQLEFGLDQSGIRAIVTYRAKRPDRLRSKIERRNVEKNYESIGSIYADVPDLAGVRIALYFPADRSEVQRLVLERFDKLREPKSDFIPFKHDVYTKQFQGYRATHFRVTFKPDTLSESQARYVDAAIEIQVASVLMHAWAEVEHDLIYKPLQGEASLDEHSILDQINGLVLTGEIALESLQRAMDNRVSQSGKPFLNHYELASYVYKSLRRLHDPIGTEPIMGRADVLFKFMELANINAPEHIEPYIPQLDLDTANTTLTDQIVDFLIDTADKGGAYVEAQSQIGAINPYSSNKNATSSAEAELSMTFIHGYTELLEIIRQVLRHSSMNPSISLSSVFKRMLPELGLSEESDWAAYSYIRDMRNGIYHRGSRYELESLQVAVSMLNELKGRVQTGLNFYLDHKGNKELGPGV